MRPLVLPVLLLAVTAAASGSTDRTAVCGPMLPNRLDTGSATQLVTAVARNRRSTQGAFRLWTKRGGCWRPTAGPWTAWLGGNGTSPFKREGDRRTPTGVFGFLRTMYGVGPNPGVRYRYRRLVCGDWWVEDPRSPYYNRFHHVPCGTRPPFRVTDEELAHSPTAYRHFAVIAFNVDPIVPGRGSGIFLHASTGRPTVGCVSLDVPHLVTTLRWLRPAADPVIVIGTRAMIRQL